MEIKRLDGASGADGILEVKRAEADARQAQIARDRPLSAQLGELVRRQRNQRATAEALARQLENLAAEVAKLEHKRAELQSKRDSSRTAEREVQKLLDDLLAKRAQVKAR